MNAFDRCGLATLSDLATTEWRDVFGVLELEQGRFASSERLFRSPEYKWPLDPLHTWSRIWEYPYCFHHVTNEMTRQRGKLPLVIDFGSGVTFFPFAIAKRGAKVACTDNDPICAGDITRASKAVDSGNGAVEFRLASGELPFNDGEADIIYSVSVLEHIPDIVGALRELERILKPGGLLVITMDIDLRGDAQIAAEPWREVMQFVTESFAFECPQVVTHPMDLLTSVNSPYYVGPRRGWRKGAHDRMAELMRAVGFRSNGGVPFLLTVQGLVLRKRG